MRKRDYDITRKIILLLVLYTIQAVPMGLSAAVPLLLQARGVKYADLAIYGLTSLPFSLKLLWAPIVDGSRLPQFGRRKSWLVPAQLLAGIAMLATGSAGVMGEWVGENGAEPKILQLTFFFFALYFLMATQDIAVDGWALEMLPPAKKKHASTCNTVGQSFGFYISNASLLILQDAETCNKFFRRRPKPYGIVSMDQFCQLWGIFLLIVTTYVVIFERERRVQGTAFTPTGKAGEPVTLTTEEAIPHALEMEMPAASSRLEARDAAEVVYEPAADEEEDFAPELTPKESYILLWRLINMRPVQLLGFLLLTSRITFAATDSAGMLKMIEGGIRKETVAVLSPLVMPWGIFSSFLAGKLIGQFTALRVFVVGFQYRTAMCFVWVAMFHLTRDYYHAQGAALGIFPKIVYWTLLYVSVSIQQIVSELMFVSQMAFFAQVSDESIGGSAMTLFNTLGNLGNKWPGFIALSLMDRMRWLPVDPFLSLTCIFVVLGLIWYCAVGRMCIATLESIPVTAWLVTSSKPHTSDEVLPPCDSVAAATSRGLSPVSSALGPDGQLARSPAKRRIVITNPDARDPEWVSDRIEPDLTKDLADGIEKVRGGTSEPPNPLTQRRAANTAVVIT